MQDSQHNMEELFFVLLLAAASVHSVSINHHAINKRESNIAVLSTSNEAVPSANRPVNTAGPTNASSAVARGQSARSVEPVVVSAGQPVVTVNQPAALVTAAVSNTSVPVAVVPVAVAATIAPPVITLANASGTALQGQVNTAHGLPAGDSTQNAGTNLAAASEAATIVHNNAVINAINNSRPPAEAPALVITA